MAKLAKDEGTYAVLELNQVAFPRDGRIEAQLPLKAEATSGDSGFSKANPAEVGMLLVVDKAAGCVRKYDSSIDTTETAPMFALNYSTEHMYDERCPQLDQFCMYPGQTDSYDYRTGFHDDFYPRMGFLAVGDRFTTNAIELGDSLTYETIASGIGTTAYYAGVDASGYWKVATDVPSMGPVAQIVEATRCPNDIDKAFKLVIVKA